MPATPYCAHPQSLEHLIDLLDRQCIAHTPVNATDNPHASNQEVAVLVLPDDTTASLYPQLLADFPNQGFWPTLAHPQDPQNPWYPWVDGDLVEPSTHLIFSNLRDFYRTAGVDYFTRPTATNPQLLADPESLTDDEWLEEEFWNGLEFPPPIPDVTAAFFDSLSPIPHHTAAAHPPTPEEPAALLITPTHRPADVPAAVGWLGACNYDFAGHHISAVLRSWEDRFGAILTSLDSQDMTLTIPPLALTDDERTLLTLEHYFFCRSLIDDATTFGHQSAALATSDAQQWVFHWE